MKLILVQPTLSYETDADNPGVIECMLAPLARTLEPLDLVLLPEHFDLRSSRAAYEQCVRSLAQQLGCHVIGGSHHEQRGDSRVNAGIVSDGRGQIVGHYEKLRPYASERASVREGSAFGEVTIGDRNLLLLICADFWFSDVFYRAHRLPDLVLVPAHSVTRKPTPDYSRALWRHLAVTRAYEFGAYVGISDWAYTPRPNGLSASGVSGFADPTTIDPEHFFTPVQDGLSLIELDFDALAAFRRDREARGFFWQPRG
ncbi:MAG TPA: carbon-nitrogen hydrolase family protein [Polyangiales bacterium]|nr:carbon-nitrogen hydrolase family protein [Polyangiales bacterium]